MAESNLVDIFSLFHNLSIEDKLAFIKSSIKNLTAAELKQIQNFTIKNRRRELKHIANIQSVADTTTEP